MSRKVIIGAEQMLAPWMDMTCHSHGAFHAQCGRGFAMVEMDEEHEDRGNIIAGVWFEGFNGANMNIHVAAVPNKRWCNRTYLSLCFHYAFVQCKAKRLTGFVAASNHAARRFDEHLGFRMEAVLKDGAPDGDMLVYVMRKEDCRWLQLGRYTMPDMKLGVN